MFVEEVIAKIQYLLIYLLANETNIKKNQFNRIFHKFVYLIKKKSTTHLWYKFHHTLLKTVC